MPIDFRNINTVWASILTETLKRLGLTTAVICPGSRSAPLAVAFAQQNEIESIPVLDERSAAFLALGIAKATQRPVVLVCTSGTAGANFYPAVIEARESRVPLLILTADRPPELRDCHSGQTIDQLKLYGHYPNWQTELSLPSVGIGRLRYLRQTLVHAWERALFPTPGPVHLNIPFRDPLAPLQQLDPDTLPSPFELEEFFTDLSHSPLPITPSPYPSPHSEWQQCDRGIIIAGVAQPQHPKNYCDAIAHLSQTLGWPVLAEGLSPVRNNADINPYLISTYDFILRNPKLTQPLTPKMVIQIGELPTSKELRTWLDQTQPQRWIIDPSHHNLDPLHGKTTHLRTTIEQLVTTLPPIQKARDTVGELTDGSDPSPTPPLRGDGLSGTPFPCREGGRGVRFSEFANNIGKLWEHPTSGYLKQWCELETQVRSAVDQKMATMTQLFEGKVAWLLSQILPPETPLFIANSMPVRDVEFFWKPNKRRIQPFFNRGANGIDGTLSTALGMAHRNQSSVMLTGDLALLHDTNGFLLRNKFVGHLTIVLINNNGGGIFEMLPISKFDPPFEEFFATPQNINFAQLCVTYGVEHQLIESWEQFKELLNPLPAEGIRVLELQTNRNADAKWRKEYLVKLASGLKII
ncbi:2-succinyl-5-enolpyruvyl-6-hydroxy-3-cyclohexene-1-carboxylic-acid synthase [Microcoleus sp. FACHB-53]|nr:2-succinyl-5-enolpyruvyl-6-hydroxy-3-cyclohexene-1-carboxylic-acid synthase [Microcoleus sp. FACHB-53]